tara:strand:+ start:11308 stop:11775 length:468 start_codon:yes stop_codon:yes gene_type:complete
MFAETLAGIALCKSAFEAIKKGVNTAKDVSELAQEIDKFFNGEQEVNRAANKKAGATDISLKSVAQEVIDRKLAAEQRQQLSTMIDLRFGPGTFASIVHERARRIQEQKLKAKQEQIKRNKEHHAMMETLKQVMLIFLILVLMGGSFVLMIAFAK